MSVSLKHERFFRRAAGGPARPARAGRAGRAAAARTAAAGASRPLGRFTAVSPTRWDGHLPAQQPHSSRISTTITPRGLLQRLETVTLQLHQGVSVMDCSCRP